jgi:small conductance mechanosensitive channel
VNSLSTTIDSYVNEISTVGGELGPLVLEGIVLLVLVLITAKYLGIFLSKFLINIGVPERKANLSITGLHILVLLIGALVVLGMVGFSVESLFRVSMIVVMVFIALYIVAKPYIPTLPFTAGDLISTSAGAGIVHNISVMYTQLRTFEGKIISIPNYKIFNDAVTNYSVMPNRRVDIDFYILYGQDLEKVTNIVDEILEQDDIVLEKPAPRVVIDKFNTNYMEMKARFWVERKHALTGRWGLNKKILTALEKYGIPMAYSQMEVNLARRG